MPLSEFTRKLVETKLTDYCNKRIAPDIQSQLRIIFEIKENNITLIETRPYYADPSIWTKNPIAQFRYDDLTQKWGLYCSGRTSRWQLYPGIKPMANFDDLLKEVDRDPIHIIWG